MSYELLAIVLLLVGCALIAAEVFIPSGGMIAVLCFLSFVVSVWSAYKAWGTTSPGYWWTYLAAVIVLIPGTIVGIFRLLSHTPLGDRILLAAPRSEDVVPYQDEAARLAGLIGRRGVALTLLTPGGLAQVGDERLHCTTDGLVVEAGQPVEVVGVKGTYVVVHPVDLSVKGAAAPPVDLAARVDAELPPAPEAPETAAPLDFDVPQG